MCIWGNNAYKVRDLKGEEIDAYKALIVTGDGKLASPMIAVTWKNDELRSLCPVEKHKESEGIYCFAEPKGVAGYGGLHHVEVWLKIGGRVAYHRAANSYEGGYRAERARAVAWRSRYTTEWQPLDTLPGRVRGLDKALQTIDETPGPIIVSGQHRLAAIKKLRRQASRNMVAAGIFLAFAVAWNVAVVTGLFGL